MKLLSWNINGLRAAVKKGTFLDFINKENPDILCLQETKAEKVDILLPNYPHLFWNPAERKGYSGTAIFSKHPPLAVTKGIGIKEHDTEGRVITLEFADYYLITAYIPNSGRGLPRLEYRKKWDNDFFNYLKTLENKKPLILCGDLNVAHKEIDLANPKENYNKTAGYTQVEIDGFQNLIDFGFIDSFREFNQEAGNYSYWGVWNNLRERNIGWRIDYFLISPALKQKLKNSFILPEVKGSDHCPVGIVLDLD